MVRTRLLALVALALAASLSFIGCSDPEGNNGNNGNNGDAGMDVQEDTGEEDTGGDVEEDVDEGCTSDSDCTGSMTCNMSTGECEMPASGCQAEPRPARCDEDPSGTDWAAASVISSLEIAGWTDANEDGQFQQEEFSEDDCCYDFDGDNENDNGLGALLAQFGSVIGLNIAEANVSLQEAIDDGSLIIVFEHQGLEDLAGDDFDINFLLGELDGVDAITTDGSANNPVMIDPQSFEDGSYPQARIPDATLESDGSITAGPGNARLRLDLFGATINLAIRQAQVTTSVAETPESTLDEGGVFLTEGELGGFTTVADLFDALNSFGGTCDCLGLADGENLIDYDPNDPLNPETTMCNENMDAGACECTGDNPDTCDDTCFQIADNCGLVVNVGPGLADLDTDGDGAVDSISLGLRFTAAGANITGVASGQ